MIIIRFQLKQSKTKLGIGTQCQEFFTQLLCRIAHIFDVIGIVPNLLGLSLQFRCILIQTTLKIRDEWVEGFREPTST